MRLDELREKRFYILLEALLKGLSIPYHRGWSLFLSEGILYQTFFNKEKKEQITHKSVVTLQSFINYCSVINSKELKKIYGMVKLSTLQKKLIEKAEEEEEK